MFYRFQIVLISLLLNISWSFGQKLSMEDKLYGLSLFWQEANYNFVFFDQVPNLDWDAEYIKAIQEVQNTKSDVAYYQVLQRFAAKLKDGHSQVYLPDRVQNMQRKLGLSLAEVQGKVVVTASNEALKHSMPVGSQILRVNNENILDYLEDKVFPQIASSTRQGLFNLGLEKLFEGMEQDTFVIEITTPKGKTKTVTIPLNQPEYVEQVKPMDLNVSFEIKALSGFTYINLPSFEKNEIVHQFRQHIAQINRSNGLIIDLRSNGGGQSIVGLNIATHCVALDQLVDMPWKSRQHIGSLKAWGNSGLELVGYKTVKEQSQLNQQKEWLYMPSDSLVIPDNIKKITVPIVVLVNERTASSAENFLVYMMQDPTIKIIGTPTFGSTGQPIYFELPGQAVARICAKRNYLLNGQDFVGKGIQPHILVRSQIEDIINQKDAPLQRALDYLKKGM